MKCRRSASSQSAELRIRLYPILCCGILFVLFVSGCVVKPKPTPETLAAIGKGKDGGFIVTWRRKPVYVGDAVAFAVAAINPSSELILPTNIPPAWVIVKTNNSTTVGIAGTAPIGSSGDGLSLEFAADFSGHRQTTNIYFRPTFYTLEEKSPVFVRCPSGSQVFCHTVQLTRTFEGDPNKNNVIIRVDSTGSASNSGNVARFEAGQSTNEEKLESGGTAQVYEQVETYSGMSNWLVIKGEYRVVLRGLGIEQVAVHGIQTEIH